MSIKISIVDDHPMVITGVVNMLQGLDDMTVLKTYLDGNELMRGLEEHLPDVLLLDIEMAGKTGDELAPVILKKFPDLKILALTNYDSTLYVQNMFRHGVLGYILKTTDRQSLIEAIRTVYAGQEFLQKVMREKMDYVGQRMKREVSTKSNLTPREKEILQCMVDGCSTQETADKLFLSLRTVENYRSNIYLKLDVKNIAMLVKKALQMGLVE